MPEARMSLRSHCIVRTLSFQDAVLKLLAPCTCSPGNVPSFGLSLKFGQCSYATSSAGEKPKSIIGTLH